eukprot:10108006-Prorocentrum_lima.AAC.1
MSARICSCFVLASDLQSCQRRSSSVPCRSRRACQSPRAAAALAAPSFLNFTLRRILEKTFPSRYASHTALTALLLRLFLPHCASALLRAVLR